MPVVVGTDGGVRHEGVVARALLTDGEGEVRVRVDVAGQLEDEEVVAAGVRVACDVFEHGLDIAAPIVDDVGLVADLDALGLLGGDGNLDGVAAVGHVQLGQRSIRANGIAGCDLDRSDHTADLRLDLEFIGVGRQLGQRLFFLFDVLLRGLHGRDNSSRRAAA